MALRLVRPVSERIPLSRVRYGHSPDKRGERRDKYGRQPIDVKRSGGGYVVHDGNDRVHYARQRGDTHIAANIVTGAASSGCMVMSVALVGVVVLGLARMRRWGR